MRYMAFPIRKEKSGPKPRRETELTKRLITWRLSKNLSQTSVAKAAGISVSSLSLNESGRTEPSHDNLTAIVERGLGISMARFYGRLPRLAQSSNNHRTAA